MSYIIWYILYITYYISLIIYYIYYVYDTYNINLICKFIIIVTFYLKNVNYVENECTSFNFSKFIYFIRVMAAKAAVFIVQLTVGWESQWRLGNSYCGHKRIDHNTRHEKSQSQPWASHRQLDNWLTVSSCWARLRDCRFLI